MRFVLVHGWGFHAGIWDEFVRHLPDAEISRVDLGFVKGGPAGVSDWHPDSIAVGHSLGLLWLLKQGRGRFRALVSIQGFDCFSCHMPRSRVLGMQRTLKRDADATLRAFWQACGTEPFAAKDALNVEALGEGLDWVASWDARAENGSFDLPHARSCLSGRRNRAAVDERDHLERRCYMVGNRRPRASVATPRLVRPTSY